MKKFTSAAIAICFVFFLFSCSGDDTSETSSAGGGNLKLTGKVMSPNNAFPISRAKVRVFKGNEMISEKITDALGGFAITDLPKGNFRVELSKGKFKRDLDVDMQGDYDLPLTQRSLNVFPKMAVVKGSYDQIEQVLVNIGVVDTLTGAPAFDILPNSFIRPGTFQGNDAGHHHTATTGRLTTTIPANVSFGLQTLLHDATLLNSYDILFLNCGGPQGVDATAINNLKVFIESGGILYATDWMYTYVQTMFNQSDYMQFSAPIHGGDSLTANVHLLNQDLIDWLAGQGITADPITINGFLPGWQMVDTFNATNVTSWLQADEVNYDGAILNDKALAFTFPYGSGGVFYSSFHTHGNDAVEPIITQMMNYFIFQMGDL